MADHGDRGSGDGNDGDDFEDDDSESRQDLACFGFFDSKKSFFS